MPAIVAAMPPAERDELFSRFLAGDDPHLATKVRRRLAPRSAVVANASGRTAGQLRAQADERAEAHDATRRQAADRNRIRELDALAARGAAPWTEVDQLVDGRSAATYDAAVKLLADLRDVSVHTSALNTFARRVGELLARHANKRSFVERVKRKGLV